MSVIVKSSFDDKFRAFVKGSPEKVSELCDIYSLPENFDAVLNSYAKEGYRIIALAGKTLPNMNYRKSQTIQRDEVESNLTFLGLLVMENRLKKETNDVIKTLNDCNVRTVMATGDNILTAISVARQCNILTNSQKVTYIGELEQKIGDADADYQVSWKRQDIEQAEEIKEEKLSIQEQSFNRDLDPCDLPWHYKDENIAVAMTGKTLRWLVENRSGYEYELKSVLHRA
jgi:cation-transporting ATPase 13A3/4/5